MNDQKFLTKEKQLVLNDALYYMKMDELKKACVILSLPNHGKKIDLITRIITFVQSGKIITSPTIPKESRSTSHPAQPLTMSSLMLYGSYKNDARTRTFFKKLIGPQFHFTAFGIDWLNDCWLRGEPPTYQEFANYWIKETKHREQIKPRPKDEWKYINFLQQMNKENPLLSKKELMDRWKKLQADKASLVFEILELLRKKIC